MKKKVVIIGAGLVGSLLSIFLSKRGYKVDVYDKRPDPHTIDEEGRSINLAVSERAWNALRTVGLEDEIKSIGIPMYGRKIHQQNNDHYFQKYTSDNKAIYSTGRSILNQKLIEAAKSYPETSFYFNSECTEVNENTLKINNSDVKFDILFGADGINSVVRKSITNPSTDHFKIELLEHQYVELHINPRNNDWVLDKNHLHIWPRKSFMLIALPNLDGSFTCTLFLPNVGDVSIESIKNNKSLQSICKEFFPDVHHLLEYPTHPKFGILGTLKGNKWHEQNKICLIGDAAHAIVPFYGQGMNAGFEDCFVIDNILERANDFNFDQFQKERRINTDAIADLALQNFIEMRDLVGNESFIRKKKLDQLIHQNFPLLWKPIYDQVSFSNRQYHKTLSAKNQQENILKEIDQNYEWQKKWPTSEIHRILTKYFKE